MLTQKTHLLELYLQNVTHRLTLHQRFQSFVLSAPTWWSFHFKHLSFERERKCSCTYLLCRRKIQTMSSLIQIYVRAAHKTPELRRHLAKRS